MTISSFAKISKALPVAAMLAVVACGGGGSGSGPQTTMDGGQTGGNTGGSPPSFTASNVIPTYVRRFLDANSIVVSDTSLDFDDSYGTPPHRWEGEICPATGPCVTASSESTFRSMAGSGHVSEIRKALEANQSSQDVIVKAVAEYRGVSLYRISSPVECLEGCLSDEEEEKFEQFGGWLDHNLFEVEATFGVTTGRLSEEVSGLSFGSATGTNPLSGNAVWRGAMVGRDVSASATQGNSILGDADLTMDFANAVIDVAFTNIRDVDDGSRRADLTWNDIPATGGGFSAGTTGRSVQGQFYGPNHKEVGGTFEGGEVIGAFGAAR